MTKAIAKKANFIMYYRERVFAVLVACLLISLCWYGYSLRQAIDHVVVRESIIKQMQSKSSNVANLESKYFSLKNSVNIELAHKVGFKDASVSMYISKKSL